MQDELHLLWGEFWGFLRQRHAHVIRRCLEQLLGLREDVVEEVGVTLGILDILGLEMALVDPCRFLGFRQLVLQSESGLGLG